MRNKFRSGPKGPVESINVVDTIILTPLVVELGALYFASKRNAQCAKQCAKETQTRPDQIRPDLTRSDQNRPDQTRPDQIGPAQCAMRKGNSDQIRPDLTRSDQI